MKLRFILFILSLLTFLSVSIGGYLYYSSLREAAFAEAEQHATAHVNALHKSLLTSFSGIVKPAKIMAGMEPLALALAGGQDANLASANSILDYFKNSLNASVCYLLDREGNTIASSNRNDADSFVGINFSFRPYFTRAILGLPTAYLALGTTSNLRGAYYSHPVYTYDGYLPFGVAIIKVSIDSIEQEIGLSNEDIVLITDPSGVIFISNQHQWLYHLAWDIPESDIRDIRETRQFGDGPYDWIGLRQINSRQVLDANNVVYQFYHKELDGYEGWRIIYLRNRQAISRTVSDPLIQISGQIGLWLCILIGISVFVLYGKATQELARRKEAEDALQESTGRYRSLYHHTPAMLHSIDFNGNLISVSDYWLEAMGYSRDEVIGKHVTEFFSPDSRNHAERVVIPQFFQTGFCKDVPYQYVQKNGRIIDVLLSAIAERDNHGTIIRSLAVSIDITERKQAEEALKQAQDALKQYSRKLEIEVAKRTREISGILKYTPDIVYIKDRDNRYRLINSRFEALFNLKSEDVMGRTDHDILPEKIANTFYQIDQQIIETPHPIQLEESIPAGDGNLTFLSVKFPMYDESGNTSGVCGILTDITAIKKMQDQFRRLSASFMNSQEKERAAIARELHDELGQVLTALRMDSVWMRDRLRLKDPDAFERAANMCVLIDKNIQDIRGIALRLRPRVLDDLGLVDALEWFTADFERRTGIACIFHPGSIRGLSDGVATAAYRIVQEALTNVARHSGATYAEVTLTQNDGKLNLSISDNGTGFQVQDMHEFEGLGIAGMRERASLIGGTIALISSSQEGTRLVFSAPVQNEQVAL
ncbi:MAG: PAS domain S-box protein [Desulfatirhabdiaceae bacterium]